MGQLATLEKKLGDLYKSAPALPKDVKKTIVEWWPIVALVLGVIQLLAAWGLWSLYRTYDRVSDFANEFTRYYTGQSAGLDGTEKAVILASIGVVLVSGAIMVAAYGPLKAKAKRGWDLLFLGVLINVIYAVLNIFIDNRGIGSFIMSLVGTAIGLYFLFQIRDAYTKKAE